jgi:hypothetical protein
MAEDRTITMVDMEIMAAINKRQLSRPESHRNNYGGAYLLRRFASRKSLGHDSSLQISESTILLTQTSSRRIDRASNGLARYNQFNPPIGLSSGGVIV